ncbi:hypothetical protein [Streptomyces cellulosae]|uniref:Uncharacterized protein n=1 Tax=Streptomyces cellulosae TaxID=1968 RepID=A0ABW7XZG2_STRCE
MTKAAAVLDEAARTGVPAPRCAGSGPRRTSRPAYAVQRLYVERAVTAGGGWWAARSG